MRATGRPRACTYATDLAALFVTPADLGVCAEDTLLGIVIVRIVESRVFHQVFGGLFCWPRHFRRERVLAEAATMFWD